MTKQRPGPKPKPKEPAKMGRPMKGNRRNVTIHMEARHIAALDKYAEDREQSRADAMYALCENGIKSGFLEEPTE